MRPYPKPYKLEPLKEAKNTLGFRPPWWARNAHIQTILSNYLPAKGPSLTQQRLELDDGDFIDLAWSVGSTKRIVMILHGLEGGVDSRYVKRIMQACSNAGICAVLHQHRSCSGEPNRLARSYHSGESKDFRISLEAVRERYPAAEIVAVGYSLGGNVLAKHLGETRGASGITRAVVVSAPLRLSACAKKLESGFATLYQGHLMKSLVAKTQAKIEHPLLSGQMPLPLNKLHSLKTFYEFDDAVTAPLHGFDGVEDYYNCSSGMQYLKHIEAPTLVMHAADDPFMTSEVVPVANELSKQVVYEIFPYGGHVGFISGGTPWKPKYFLEDRVMDFLL